MGINILITSIGSPGFGPSLVKILRRSIKGIKIYGMDISNESAVMHMVDYPIIAPPYGEKQIRFIYDISKRRKIDIILALNATEELLPLTEWNEEQGIFDKIGTKIVGMPSRVLRKRIFKNLTYEYLKKNHLNYPHYFTPKNLTEFRKAATTLGYPNNKIVVKPINGAGNRGFWILNDKFDLFSVTVGNKADSLSVMTLKQYEDILRTGDKFPEIVLMEYMSGEEYTVYCLADNGKPLYIIPLLRLKPVAGMSLIAQVNLNKVVIEYSKKIICAFDLHANIDLQMKFNRKGKPILYEINPRYSASIILPYAAGVDLAYFGILQVLGKRVPKVHIKDKVKMIRYFNEIFIRNKERFYV
jgi:carbamoyl-phosphate synthase large subunit